MRPRRTVLTTGEVAKICNVAPRTVSKWFDDGHLRGYRIPGSKDRRIPVEQLVEFMRAHGIPLNGLETGAIRVLILDSDVAQVRAVAAALDSEGGLDVRVAESAIEAGAIVQHFKPHVFIVDVGLPDVEPLIVSRFVRSLPFSEPILLIGTATNLGDAEGQALRQHGFDAYLARPFESRSLVRLIEERLAVAAESESE